MNAAFMSSRKRPQIICESEHQPCWLGYLRTQVIVQRLPSVVKVEFMRYGPGLVRPGGRKFVSGVRRGRRRGARTADDQLRLSGIDPHRANGNRLYAQSNEFSEWDAFQLITVMNSAQSVGRGIRPHAHGRSMGDPAR